MPTTPSGDFDRERYERLASARRKLVTPLVTITVVAFWAQQLITNFTPWMDGTAFTGMTWAYLYSFALFFLVVILTTHFRRKMAAIEAELDVKGGHR